MGRKNKAKAMQPAKSDPATPAYPTRRSFLNLLWIGLGLLGLAELVAVAVSYLKPGRRVRQITDPGSVLAAGNTDQFALRSVTPFVQGKFYLCRMDDGGFLAVSRQCTHLGCTVPWDEEKKQFVCPCHASVFDIRGEVVRSPAPRALDIYPVTIVNHQISVDTGRRIRRNGFEPKQVVYPKRQ